MNWEELGNSFINQKQFLGYKYKTDLYIIKEIVKFLTNENVIKISKETIDNYAKINPNIKVNTIARNINVFKEFCKYLETQGVSCYQIPKKIYSQKSKKYIPYIFSKEEIKLIITNSYKLGSRYSYRKEQILPLIYKLLYQTGMRIGEILNLRIKNYLNQESFLIEQSKNNSERLIYLPESLNEEILKYHLKFHSNCSKDDYFFKLKENKINIYTIDRNFYEVLKLAKIKKKENTPRVHDLRHTYIVHCIEKWLKEGKNINAMLPILQAQVGHSSLKSLEYYFHITQNIINEIGKISEEKLGKIIPNIKELDNE